jgi:lysine-specific demethylase 8
MSFLRLKPSTIAHEALKTHLGVTRPLPLHIQDITARWPASSLWTLNNGLQALRDTVGDTKEVDVELGQKGRGYLDPGYQRVSMGFGKSSTYRPSQDNGAYI